MFYYLYQIQNMVNGKIYVGAHETADINDGYMGSGTAIKQAIKKYGSSNFQKVILEMVNSREELYNREREMVSEEFVNRKDTYNQRLGGMGGFFHVNCDAEFHQKCIAKGVTARLEQMKLYGNPLSGQKSKNNFAIIDPENRKKVQQLANSEASIVKKKNTFILIKHAQGKNNSQFGTTWITNGVKNKKIIGDIPLGWKKGRIVK